MTAAADHRDIIDDLELPEVDVPWVELTSVAPTEAPALVDAAGESGCVLASVEGAPEEHVLAGLRDALWPRAQLAAYYRVGADGAVVRRSLSGAAPLDGRLAGPERTVLFVRGRDAALGRAVTRAKFDANAEGWNGAPGTPTYGHYRWMRRLLAQVARPSLGLRTLDAGCGAGWVGIEAARMGAMASAFDPSPAMVEIAKRNAEELGVDLDARVGFVEEVPFEKTFDLVLNSGVISFAPDTDVYVERLDALVSPGGLLVIGDLNPASRGFRRRRRRPLLPARELNGVPRPEIERVLTERGYTIEGHWLYQLTFPVPELMALSEQRMGGFGCGLALLLNKLATQLDHLLGSPLLGQFDSWIVRARKSG